MIATGLATSLAVAVLVMAAGALAQGPRFSQVCRAGDDGGKLVNRVCVLPATTIGRTGNTLPLMATNGEGISSLQTHSITVTKPPLDKLVCSPGSNGGTLVEGVCVLPGTNVGQDYEGFILTSNNSGGTFSIVAGSLAPGLFMPARYGAAGTIVGGIPTKEGTFTFTVTGTDQEGQRMKQTYSITVGPPLPLKISFPAICCNAGKVGKSYLQDVFLSGGVGPYTATITAGKLPSGLRFSRKPSFSITGTPTSAGTFSITITVTDGRGAHASKRGTIKIS
jgi:hypothetical protein